MFCESCRAKRAEMHDCAACKKRKLKECFDPNVFHHAKYHGRDLVCVDCNERRLSAKRKQEFSCGVCKQRKKHLEFPPMRLANYKRKRSSKMICLACVERQKELEKNLRIALGNQKAWRCTCSKGQRAKTAMAIVRAHDPSHDKCNLRSTRHGKGARWPGGPDALTGFQQKDWLFLETFANYHKA